MSHNPHQGDVVLDVAGKSYTLKYSIDAFCALEEKAGKGFPSIAQELGDEDRVSIRTVRMVLWAGLLEHQPDMTLKGAGDLIVPLGGLLKTMPHITRAIKLAFPDVPSEAATSPPAVPT